MKEIFTHYFNEHPDASDAEYQDWLNSQEPVTQDQVETNHDAWWDSLTDEQKQHLFEEQEAMEKERIELSIEEMNHDFGLGL